MEQKRNISKFISHIMMKVVYFCDYNISTISSSTFHKKSYLRISLNTKLRKNERFNEKKLLCKDYKHNLKVDIKDIW